MIFEIEGDLAFGRVGGAERERVAEARLRRFRQNARRAGRDRAGSAAEGESAVDEAGLLPARPFDIGDGLLADAAGEIGAEAAGAAVAVIEQLRAEILGEIDIALQQ